MACKPQKMRGLSGVGPAGRVHWLVVLPAARALRQGAEQLSAAATAVISRHHWHPAAMRPPPSCHQSSSPWMGSIAASSGSLASLLHRPPPLIPVRLAAPSLPAEHVEQIDALAVQHAFGRLGLLVGGAGSY